MITAIATLIGIVLLAVSSLYLKNKTITDNIEASESLTDKAQLEEHKADVEQAKTTNSITLLNRLRGRK